MKTEETRQAEVELDGGSVRVIVQLIPATGEPAEVRVLGETLDGTTLEPSAFEWVADAVMVERAAAALKLLRASHGDTRAVCADHGYHASGQKCPVCVRDENARESVAMLQARQRRENGGEV